MFKISLNEFFFFIREGAVRGSKSSIDIRTKELPKENSEITVTCE
jgi:hypothetical protein